jgi:tryptophan halogenase
MIKNLAIVGGGTAGWLTALYLNKILESETSITVIESDEIGIIGVGEGSTPSFVTMLNLLGIDIDDFILKTNATHKLGIMFENWNGDGNEYFHSFGTLHKDFDYLLNDRIVNTNIAYAHIGKLFSEGKNFEDIDISYQVAKNNLSPNLKNKLNDTNTSLNYSLHFDSHLVSDYFRKIAISRGVNSIVNKVISFGKDDIGNINSINFSNNLTLTTDFVFDCTGFHRLLIGKEYNSNWKPYTNQLKVSKAITFQIPQTDNIKPYTRSIAMQCGWLWQIPLQNRIGCGYNFDDNFISTEEAKNEVEKYLGFRPTFGKEITYNAGVYEKVWINNCIAIGLSSGFTEPIEATSIFNSISQLWFITKGMLYNYDTKVVDYYNDIVSYMNDSVLDFLYFHYITKRNDTIFWKEYKNNTIRPNSLEQLFEKWKTELPTFKDFENHPFGLHSWLSVGIGLDFLNKNLFLEKYNKSNKEHINNKDTFIKSSINDVLNNSYYESEYLNKIKQ